MVKLLFFHFRVTNWNFKSIKLHFDLLIQLQIQFYLCPVPLEDHQEKTSLFFDHPLNKIIFTS